MKTIARIMALMAVTTVALSSGAIQAAEPPETDPGRELCFELVDGTVITGRIDVKVITFRVSGDNVLKISVKDLKELTIGINQRPEFIKRVESLVKALDSPKTRQGALRELIALGPAVTPIVILHAASDITARRRAIGQTLKAYESWRADHPNAHEAMARPLELKSKVRAGESTFIGTVTVKQFRIASPYGPAAVRPGEVYRIRPSARTTPDKFNRAVIAMRDKTRLTGTVINQSLRIQTRHGTMVIPLARIQKATIAADGKSIRIQCWGSDRIAGVIEPKTTISLKTDKGKADLPAGKIALVVYGPLTLKGHSKEVCSVAFSPDGKRLASGSWDKTIKLWDTATGEELLWLKRHSGLIRSLAFSPDGKRLASGSTDSTIKLWDTVTGKELLTLKGHSSRVFSAAFSPDGKRLASGSEDHTIKLWDTVTGKQLLTLKGHARWVNSVTFSPDGKRLASGSRDNTTKLWDTVTGKELLTLKGHYDHVLSVAFSPDGKLLASGSVDRTIKLWDTVTGKELLTLTEHAGWVNSVSFSPDGKRLASGSSDKTTKLRDLPDWTKSPK